MKFELVIYLFIYLFIYLKSLLQEIIYLFSFITIYTHHSQITNFHLNKRQVTTVASNYY